MAAAELRPTVEPLLDLPCQGVILDRKLLPSPQPQPNQSTQSGEWMMRLSTRLSTLASFVAAAAALVAVTATTESRAGDEELLSIKCAGGDLTVTAKDPWHTNKAAPWKWDKGEK